MRPIQALLVCASALGATCNPAHETATTMPASDRRAIPFAELLDEPMPRAGKRINYDTGPLQFGELRVRDRYVDH